MESFLLIVLKNMYRAEMSVAMPENITMAHEKKMTRSIILSPYPANSSVPEAIHSIRDIIKAISDNAMNLKCF